MFNQAGLVQLKVESFNFLSMMRKGVDVTVVQGPSPTCSALDATFITEIC